MADEGPLSFKEVGLNKGFKFPLFCPTHDDTTFVPIEKNHPVDFSSTSNASLLTFRTICMELRKKEISIDCYQSVYNKRKEILKTIDYLDLQPAKLAIKDMLFYKSELEKSLFNETNSQFNFKVIELPLKKICFSIALSIHDPTNFLTYEYDEYGYTKKEPILTTFLNYFPYGEKSLLIAAQHINFPCNWTSQLLKDISDKLKYNKVLSDLLTFRIEQWGMSSEIYKNLSEKKKIKFISESLEQINNYDYVIDSNFNLFE